MNLYEKESESFTIVNTLHSEYYLMNVVDNDYIGGDLEEVFKDFVVSNSDFIHRKQQL